MRKNVKTHLLAVVVAWILSYGFYLIFTNPTQLPADILWIQNWETSFGDIEIEQLQDHIVFRMNREITDLSSIHFLVMYDDEYVQSDSLWVQSNYPITSSFTDNQWMIIVNIDTQVSPNKELFIINGIESNQDLIIADIFATFEDETTERLLFSQP